MPAGANPWGRRFLWALVKLALLAAVVVAANRFFAHLQASLEFDIRPGNEDLVHRAIMTTAALYAAALAVPFVPGVELGLGLIAVFGARIVPLVYGCTVTGLLLAFLIGRLIPPAALIRFARDLRLARLAALLGRFDATPDAEKLALLLNRAPNAPVRFLLRHRYLALAVALNLPGNFVIGGGGGLAMMCGVSRLFALPAFVLTVLLAVAPVPVAILVFGPAVLAP